MKYSGVEWIGEIPDKWGVRKVKQCFYISKEQAHIENPTILSLARAGVKVRDITNNEGQLAASYDNYNPVMPGDLLLNPMDLYSGANCSLSEVSGVISPAYINLRKKVELNPKFYDYYFKTQYWAMAMFAHGKGVSFDNRWTMNAETLLNYYLPFPSSKVQDKIVNLINKKTAEIDSLIEIENQQIEKLKEYKQAVITEAVTRGLDKKVPLKDSGVEWIGMIPDSWTIRRFKTCHNGTNVGESINKEYISNDNECLVFYTAGLSEQYTTYNLFPEWKYTKKRDLLLSRNGNPYVFIPKEGALYSDHVIRTEILQSFDKKFLMYSLQTSILYEKAEGVSIVTWSAEIWNKQKIATPTLEIQKSIVKYLDEESE